MNRWLWLLILGVTLVAPKTEAQTVNGTLVGDESFYGAALSVQNTQTGYGNASIGDPSNAGRGPGVIAGGGSEIDQVFGKISGGRLHMLVTGNLESNFNKLEIFIDSAAGGVNIIDALDDPPTANLLPGGVDAFCCGGFEPPKGENPTNFGALQRMDGLTFDAGFDADYFLTFTNGFESVGAASTQFWALTAHFADLTDGANGDVVRAGMALAPQGQPNVQRAQGDLLSDTPFAPLDPAGGSPTTIGPLLPGLGTGELIDRTYAQSANGGCSDDTGAGCVAAELEFVLDVNPTEIGAGSATNSSNHRNFVNSIDLKAAIDNSNTGGVSGSGGPDFSLNPTDDPENVVTGIEFSIPLSAIGNPSGDVKVTAYVGNNGHDFVSNQFAGEGLVDAGNADGLPENNLDQNLFGSSPLATLADFTGDQFVTISQAPAGVAGDYNGNGVVDAADYTVWLDALGGTTLLNDSTPGTVDASDYTFWKSRFGATSGATTGGAVPEPGSLLLLCLATLGAGAIRRR